MCDDDPSRNSLFRSRPMSYVSITAMTDIAYDTIRELGNFGLFHVVDLNAGKEASVNDKNLAGYKKRVQDCLMYERKLHDLEEQIKEYNIPAPPPLREHEERRHTHKDNAVLPDIRAHLEPLEERLRRSVQVQADITRAISELTERVWVYKTCRNMQVGRVEAHDDKHEVPYSAAAAAVPGAILVPGTTAAGLPAAAAALAPPPKQNKDVELGERPVGTPPGTTGGGDSKLNQLGVSLLSADHHAPSGAGGAAAKFVLPKFRTTLTGVLPTDKSSFFQRMLYRISRGNAITHFTDIPVPIPDAVSGELVNKSVFSVIIVVSELLEKRITKVCQLFQATLVRMPDTQAAIDEALHRTEAQIDEQRMLKVNTLRDIEQALRQLAGDPQNVSPLREWQYLLRCEKAVCDTMMKCHFYLTMVAFEGWCPVEEVDNLKIAVKRAVPPGDKIPEPAVEVAPEKPIRDPGMPPTYFKLNKFTSIFQGIVNTYGVPRYQEVNPGLFTIVTFPFLFGVMYGDIGHGTFVTILSLLMIIFEDRLTRLKESGNMNEIFRMCFGGRYLLVCMGVMGIYCGTLYNDCMSIPVSLYAPTWEYEGTADEPATRIGAVYPYGVDPAWYHTKNQLTFFNGMKMKTSVILGVTQMTFGIIMGLLNHIHFRDQISIWLEFLPQLLFMLCTFGYMCILIIIKWCTDWSQTSQEPPNLIQTMITMFLGLGGVKEGAQLYAGQSTVQAILLIIAFGSIPVMLLAKPCILAYCSKDDHGHGHAKPQAAQPAAAAAGDVEAKGFDEKGEVIPAEAPAAGAGAAHEEEHTFGDYMIHQSIHTIEFVLGTVSNTASYLRLWALSLAHSELADVFWTKLILEYGMYKNSAFFSMVAVAVWFVMTAGVLLSMDVLECFLHALRLHWVEFQNKFFHADGYAFKPFSYDVVEDS